MLLVGVALSMDAFAVTISNAIAWPHAAMRRRVLLVVLFAAFQGLMPTAGFFLAGLAAGVIESFAGVISFVILGFIGTKMAIDGIRALRKPDAQAKEAAKAGANVGGGAGGGGAGGGADASGAAGACSSGNADAAAGARGSASGANAARNADAAPAQPGAPIMLTQAFATSIDAFIVGIGFAASNTSIVIAAPLIAASTFVCCAMASVAGRRLGLLLGDGALIAGGLVLIGIGIKALF